MMAEQDQEQKWEREFSVSTDLQNEFTSRGAYVVYRRADAKGLVKIFKRSPNVSHESYIKS